MKNKIVMIAHIIVTYCVDVMKQIDVPIKIQEHRIIIFINLYFDRK